MEDKDFLGYFNKLGPPSTSLDIKAAASNIVNTLVGLGSVPGRRASTDSSSKAMEAAEIAIKAKYTTGDLGDKVSADLNYTLKRLVRGLYSENHTVKQGFFLASVLVRANPGQSAFVAGNVRRISEHSAQQSRCNPVAASTVPAACQWRS